ncbi:hypothetical protein SSX86_021749 [Deinandra increscens subsp. villosa]|uniref:Glucose-methanol-choline oxidoreductase N-terminal domain-containing protein n=1 Tax=Deinandra increscens subsp. villosa TaxID=3103831 RepID=A0AAP0GU43_9ASTR
MHEATEAPSVSFFDYIVIGGGTAGIPIAATLSANYSVLLLERGKSPYNDPNITSVFNFGRYFFDTSPDSPSQQFVVEGVVNSRPRVLGGGTSINAGFYSRGEKKFNTEAKLTDEDLILDSYEWTEKVIVFEPVVQSWQTALRAALVEAGVTPDNGFTYDHLIGTKVGGTIFDPNGTRHTAANLLEYANPEGLSLYLHATVHKILFDSTGNSSTRPKAYGVVFEDSLGDKHVAYLNGGSSDEIILAAGALGSPQLLMLSGIGPKDQLDALNITVVLEQPYVGKDMADNPLNALFIPAPIDVEPSIVQVVGITPFGCYIEEAGGFNFIFADLSDYQGYTYQKGGFVIEKINGPLSKGDLKIVNLDPGDNPSVTFNYFNASEDLQKCVEGIETILTTVNTEAFSSYKYADMTNQDILDLNMKLPYNLIEHGNTSTSLEQYCKDTLRTIWHYHGGCHIGQVVDDDYKVLGVDSLRVIDGSTILNSPGTNPQASLMMLGSMMFYKRMIACALITVLFLLDSVVADIAPNYTFMHEATEAPSVSFFDYIVIGGGTTGIPIAATLSANYSVLLLERGKSPYNDPNITTVFNFGRFFFDTSPDSPAQQFIVEGVVNTRPRVLGGGTSINAGFYSRGEEKFNTDAKLTDEDLILDSYEWTEKVIVFEPVVQSWQTALRDALVEAGVTPDNGFTYDHLIGTKVGGTIFDPNGTRHTAANLLQYANPEGLSLYVHAIVHKILFDCTGNSSRPKAYGVVFEDSLGVKHVAYLNGGSSDEIILAAGALGSPQLLMLSGIGPKDQLDALNITVVLEQPYVGKDMADNPQNILFIPSPIDVEPSIVQVVGITPFGSYIEETGGLNVIFGNLSDYQGYNYQKGGFIFEKINGPLSKGDLKIVNLDPADNPSVTFNYFNASEDLQKCVNGIETVLTAINTEAFSNYKYANMTNQDILDLNMKLRYNLNEHGNISTSLEQHCKDTVTTIWHYHGGCHIGQVVDDDYKVLGVDSLRVIDGSTLLNSPGTNPQASLMMLGRYMGVTILSQRLADQLDKLYADW